MVVRQAAGEDGQRLAAGHGSEELAKGALGSSRPKRVVTSRVVIRSEDLLREAEELTEYAIPNSESD